MIGVGGGPWTPSILRPLSALGPIATLPTTLASSVTHGDVTFPLGASYEVGNYVDGPAFVVLPSGSLTMSEPTPVQTTIGGLLANGAMLNPQANSPTGFDARPDSVNFLGSNYDASAVQQTWPLSVSAGDVLLKAVSSTDPLIDLANVASLRRGVIESYGAIFIVSEVPPANASSPSAVGWSGRGTPQHHVIDIAAKVGVITPLSSTGQTPPSYANLMARIDKYYPSLPMFGSDPFGSRLYAPKGLGQDLDLYGRYIGGNLQAGMLALNSDAFTATQKEAIATALCSMGNNFFDAYEGSGTEQSPNGGLFPFTFPPMALALDWRGDSEKLATFRTTYGGNYRQAFTVTAAQAAQMQSHTSNTQPYTWRERNIDAITGNVITISTFRSGLDGDNAKGSFKDLLLTNGTTTTLVTANQAGDNIASNDPAGQYDITVSDATGFSVNDTIWFEPYVASTEGMSDWIIGSLSQFNRYSPVEAGYRSLNEWGGGVIGLKGLGVWHSEWDPVARYVKAANTVDYPSADYDWPDHNNVFYNPGDAELAWEAEFYADHAGAILADVPLVLPVVNAFQNLADDIFVGGRTGLLIAPGENNFQETASQTTASSDGDPVGSIISFDPSANVVFAEDDAQRPELVTSGGFSVFSFAPDEGLTLFDATPSGAHTIAVALRVTAPVDKAVIFHGAANSEYAAVFDESSAITLLAREVTGTPTMSVDGVSMATWGDFYTALVTGNWSYLLIEGLDPEWSEVRLARYFSSSFREAFDIGPLLMVDDALTAQEKTDVEAVVMAAVGA